MEVRRPCCVVKDISGAGLKFGKSPLCSHREGHVTCTCMGTRAPADGLASGSRPYQEPDESGAQGETANVQAACMMKKRNVIPLPVSAGYTYTRRRLNAKCAKPKLRAECRSRSFCRAEMVPWTRRQFQEGLELHYARLFPPPAAQVCALAAFSAGDQLLPADGAMEK